MLISAATFAESIPTVAANENKWVISVSGGADSMCLICLAREYASCHGIHVFACFVDHKLRKESSVEIDESINILKQIGTFDCNILTWQHSANVLGNIEEKARNARYELLIDFCQQKGAKILMTAHHALDQWETFFMRLSRGSAIKGLASIQPVSKREQVTLVRPLLDFDPKDLKSTLLRRFGISQYFQDPMNEQLQFERVRWRKAFQKLSVEYGLDLENINKTITRLRHTNECLDHLSAIILKEIWDGDILDLQRFKEYHQEIQMRILNAIINKPIMSYDLLKRTVTKICNKDFKATNIGNMVIRRSKSKYLKFHPEKRR
jgi:tRNA(Ile)-lysidine synthase